MFVWIGAFGQTSLRKARRWSKGWSSREACISSHRWKILVQRDSEAERLKVSVFKSLGTIFPDFMAHFLTKNGPGLCMCGRKLPEICCNELVSVHSITDIRRDTALSKVCNGDTGLWLMTIPSATRPQRWPQLDKRSHACICLKEEVTRIQSRFRLRHESEGKDNFEILPLLAINVSSGCAIMCDLAISNSNFCFGEW